MKWMNHNCALPTTANYNHSLNCRLQNWCGQTLKRLHQLLCPKEPPHKCCSFRRKALWKPFLSKLRIRVFKVFCPENKQAGRDSEAMFRPWMMSGPGRRYDQMSLSCMWLPYCCRSFHLSWLFLSYIYLRDFCAAVSSFLRDEFQPLYRGGPFTGR